MSKTKFILAIGAAIFFSAQAADTYDSTKSTLTIPPEFDTKSSFFQFLTSRP